MNRACGEHRKYAASARSSGWPARPSGTSRTASSKASGLAAVNGVSVIPGDNPQIRMSWAASSVAATRIAWLSAAFVAA